jgi:hypothetical protein
VRELSLALEGKDGIDPSVPVNRAKLATATTYLLSDLPIDLSTFRQQQVARRGLRPSDIHDIIGKTTSEYLRDPATGTCTRD